VLVRYGEKFFNFFKARKFLLAHLIDFRRKFTRLWRVFACAFGRKLSLILPVLFTLSLSKGAQSKGVFLLIWIKDGHKDTKARSKSSILNLK
jgi:hypothetical protein